MRRRYNVFINGSLSAMFVMLSAMFSMIMLLNLKISYAEDHKMSFAKDHNRGGSAVSVSTKSTNYEYYHLADFSDGRATGWRLATDQVMGGVSEGTARLVMTDVGKVAHMTGKVSTANNGGFVQIRRRFEAGAAVAHDGVFLQVRGNQESYAVHLRNKQSVRPWMNYRQNFKASDDWTILYLPFSNFTASRAGFMPKSMDADSVYSIGIVAYGGNFTADLQIAQVGFYKFDAN